MIRNSKPFSFHVKRLFTKYDRKNNICRWSLCDAGVVLKSFGRGKFVYKALWFCCGMFLETTHDSK